MKSSNNLLSRRAFGTSLIAAGGLTACGNGLSSSRAADIDSKVASTLVLMFESYPGSRDLYNRASGVLVIPVISDVSFWYGAAYGRGALRVGDVTVDYYSVVSGSAGIQFGIQQYAQVLFFMNPEALRDFRHSSGWTAGANIEYGVGSDGRNFNTLTVAMLSPVIALIFGHSGLNVGASVEGLKYTRIIP